ncbi:hypothetical protein ASF24_12785 [Methylobacterium sp. Leaf86]|uniref:hypothetical protein n=1 Tax=Methylobacterium sp. Leaf86 TaxID=1736242 RepID=UPI0006F9E020|nr:hypothetical protein [Methylobacterium sp. Leaf86]KQO59061.1 hypothetical protein ASF24_12785 [Methylobacterium sp. Leaf86]
MCDTAQMTPVSICIRAIDTASEITDSTLVEKVEAAIDALEASCSTPSERVLALERVYGTFTRRRRSKANGPFGRFIAQQIDARQDRILARA